MTVVFDQGVVRRDEKRSVFQRSFSSPCTTRRRGFGHFCDARNDAQTESLDTRKTLRNCDGDLERERINHADRAEAPGIRRADAPMARTVLRRREGCTEFRGRARGGFTQPRAGARTEDRGTRKGYRTTGGRNPFFKKTIDDLNLDWRTVETARVE